jgi:hypothetical protein
MKKTERKKPMPVQIDTLTLRIPGPVTRKSDGYNTELKVTVEQAADLYRSLDVVKDLFTPQPAADE